LPLSTKGAQGKVPNKAEYLFTHNNFSGTHLSISTTITISDDTPDKETQAERKNTKKELLHTFPGSRKSGYLLAI
jgi:hypothetical protein